MDPMDKVAIVTGGASGIGLATARLLASKGARVVLADVQEEAGEAAATEIAGGGGEARFVRADVTSLDDLVAMIEFAVAQFGSAEIFHNNAGVSESGDLLSLDSDAWTRTLAIDLEAIIRATQLEVQHLRRQGGGGVIVNTASMAGLIPQAGSPVYATSKAGVIQFTRSLAYLAGEGIRVNVICPSFADTPMVRAGGEMGMEMMRREVGGTLKPELIAAGVFMLWDDSYSRKWVAASGLEMNAHMSPRWIPSAM